MKRFSLSYPLILLLCISLAAFIGCEPDPPGPEDLDTLEPNNNMNIAVPLHTGDSLSLSIYQSDEDWFQLTVPAGQFLFLRIDFDQEAGDLDLVIYSASGELINSRVGSEYPYSGRKHETGIEAFGFYSEDRTIDYMILVTAYKKARNDYILSVKELDYKNGCICEEEGFSTFQCIGDAPEGQGLIPFPLPANNDPAWINNYQWETWSNYRFARREAVMLVRYAIEQTSLAFPGTTPISLSDASQIDGLTPALEVGIKRHPPSTHDQGSNIDIAYYQTDGANNLQVICGKGSSGLNGFCKESAAENHVVDLERQAFFIGKLFDSPRVRVIGTDRVVGPLIQEMAEDLALLLPDDPHYLTDVEIERIRKHLIWGDGWPNHHHHIHVSMEWW